MMAKNLVKYVDDYEHSGDSDREKKVLRRLGATNIRFELYVDGDINAHHIFDFDGTREQWEEVERTQWDAAFDAVVEREYRM